MQRFTKLRVWERSFQFGLAIFCFCKCLPKDETYIIGAQLRRAVLSIATNIAEGSKALSLLEYANYLNIAEKSLAEVESLLLFCQALRYAPSADYEILFTEAAGIGMMLHALREKVAEKAKKDAASKRNVSRTRVNESTG